MVRRGPQAGRNQGRRRPSVLADLEGDDDVEGHGYRGSDENLNQAVTEVGSAVGSALEILRAMGDAEDDDVEATLSRGPTRTSSRR
jgi:hypothetical protein